MRLAHLLNSPAVAMAFAGGAFGLVYFAVLRRTVVMLCRRRSVAVMALTLGRSGAAIVFFALAARLDALALLTALGGFLSARLLALHAYRRR
jgi:hypothetical protein